jgi:hypothetical protein
VHRAEVIAPPPHPRARPGLPLDADLHVVPAAGRGADLAAALARAAASDLAHLGIVVHPRPDPDWYDAYVQTVRAAAAVARTGVHCGLEVALLGPDGRTDLSPGIRGGLSRVDYVVLAPAPGADWGAGGPGPRAETITLAALRAAAELSVPVVLAASFPDPAGPDTLHALGRACARAGIAIEVSERRRAPSVAAAVELARAGATLVAGSGARSAAGIGRWDHVRAVAAALDPAPPGPGAVAPVAQPS